MKKIKVSELKLDPELEKAMGGFSGPPPTKEQLAKQQEKKNAGSR